jgi:hypothetical protein
VEFRLNINCKKGINKTKERRLNTVNNRFPSIVNAANWRYLNAKLKICGKGFIYALT